MTKNEFDETMSNYNNALRYAYDAATRWMQLYQGPENLYGYKVGNLSIDDKTIRFQIYHHDGIYPRDYHTMPIDFLFDNSKMEEHVKSCKEAYTKKRKEEMAIELQIRALQERLSTPVTFTCGTILPMFSQPRT